MSDCGGGGSCPSASAWKIDKKKQHIVRFDSLRCAQHTIGRANAIVAGPARERVFTAIYGLSELWEEQKKNINHCLGSLLLSFEMSFYNRFQRWLTGHQWMTKCIRKSVAWWNRQTKIEEKNIDGVTRVNGADSVRFNSNACGQSYGQHARARAWTICSPNRTTTWARIDDALVNHCFFSLALTTATIIGRLSSLIHLNSISSQHPHCEHSTHF